MIHFISGEYPPDIGGVGDYLAALRTALGLHNSSVVTRRDVGHWDARALMWLLRHAPSDGIVHIQYQAAAFDLLGDICLLPSLLRRLRPAVRCVTTFHDVRVPYLFPRAGPLRARAVRLLARTSHAVVAADQRDLDGLGAGAGYHVPIGANVACSPPIGYARADFRRRIGLESDSLAIVYFGLPNASKGLDLLFDTFNDVLAQQPGARLLLVGGDPGTSDRTDVMTAGRVQARLARFGERAVLTGWLPNSEASAYLLAGDVALLPYLDGASARRGSLLACAAHGLPIVSTQPAGAEVAPYVRAEQPHAGALARAVLETQRQPCNLRSASRELTERTSWPKIAARHLEIYQQLLHSES